jgi:hypothetical protein
MKNKAFPLTLTIFLIPEQHQCRVCLRIAAIAKELKIFYSFFCHFMNGKMLHDEKQVEENYML